jgi:hypothetical protein
MFGPFAGVTANTDGGSYEKRTSTLLTLLPSVNAIILSVPVPAATRPMTDESLTYVTALNALPPIVAVSE